MIYLIEGHNKIAPTSTQSSSSISSQQLKSLGQHQSLQQKDSREMRIDSMGSANSNDDGHHNQSIENQSIDAIIEDHLPKDGINSLCQSSELQDGIDCLAIDSSERNSSKNQNILFDGTKKSSTLSNSIQKIDVERIGNEKLSNQKVSSNLERKNVNDLLRGDSLKKKSSSRFSILKITNAFQVKFN